MSYVASGVVVVDAAATTVTRSLAAIRFCLETLRYDVSPLIAEDRELYLGNLAFAAQRHACTGNIRGTFSIVKSITRKSIRPPPAVKLLTGEVVTDEIER